MSCDAGFITTTVRHNQGMSTMPLQVVSTLLLDRIDLRCNASQYSVHVWEQALIKLQCTDCLCCAQNYRWKVNCILVQQKIWRTRTYTSKSGPSYQSAWKCCSLRTVAFDSLHYDLLCLFLFWCLVALLARMQFESARLALRLWNKPWGLPRVTKTRKANRKAANAITAANEALLKEAEARDPKSARLVAEQTSQQDLVSK